MDAYAPHQQVLRFRESVGIICIIINNMKELNIIKCQSVKNGDTGKVETVYVYADNWKKYNGITTGMPFRTDSITEARKLAKELFAKQ